MKLVELIEADIYRDGGSYGASFIADDDREYGLWLERSRMPDGAGLHHRWLFEYRGSERPNDCVPVVTGSDEERALFDRLDEFLRAPIVRLTSHSPDPSNRLRRLGELRDYAARREPSFPADLRQQGFIR